MALVTSVPLTSANWINDVVRPSSSSPVTPNRVLSSPTASAAVWKSVGTLVATLETTVCRPSSSVPVAPVLVATVSMASSTSFHAETEAAATATTGAVTPLVSAPPTAVAFSPIRPRLSCQRSRVTLCSSSSALTSANCFSYFERVPCALVSAARFFAMAFSFAFSSCSISSS